MRLSQYILSGVVTVWLCAAAAARAYVILGEVTWNTEVEGWVADEGYVSVIHDNDGTDDYLLTTYAADRGAGQAESVVYTDTPEAIFSGTWTEEMWVEFDFWSQDLTPDFVQLQFQGSGSIWSYHGLTAPSVGPWTRDLSVSLAYSASLWSYGGILGGGDAFTFASDLAAMDWIGVYIYDGDTAANRYGLDNFQLMIPEPAEYALAFSALAVIWLSVRKRPKRALAAV